MKILFIAPLPPPLNGMSLAAKEVLAALKCSSEVLVVNQAKPKRINGILNYIGRAVVVFGFFIQIFSRRKGVDKIYFAISESYLGNAKDLIIYILCFRDLSKTYIHLLGGAGLREILEKNMILSRINKFFISRLAGIFVEGKSQAMVFSNFVGRDKIHQINNFSEDFLHIDPEVVRDKYALAPKLKILYLSNLIEGKGYLELLDAYSNMSDDSKSEMQLTFVGGFQSPRHQKTFLGLIACESGVSYYGPFVSGEAKKNLYLNHHIFCLPTYYAYEGQPISILEAYATGCVVITTKHSGIPDIFENEVNGYVVEKRSSESLRAVLERLLLLDRDQLLDIAISNSNLAKERFSSARFRELIAQGIGINTD